MIKHGKEIAYGDFNYQSTNFPYIFVHIFSKKVTSLLLGRGNGVENGVLSKSLKKNKGRSYYLLALLSRTVFFLQQTRTNMWLKQDGPGAHRYKWSDMEPR